MSSLLNIPTELQLQIVQCLPANTVQSLLSTNKLFNSLALSSVESSIVPLASSENTFYFSVFSPQVKTHLIQTYNTTCVSTPKLQSLTPLKADFQTSSTALVDLNKVSEKLNLLSSNPSMMQNLHNGSSINSPYKTLFKLGDLQYTRDPLKSDSTNILTSEKETSSLNLVLNEDEPFINIQFEMQMKENPSSDKLSTIFNFHSRINSLKEIGSSYSGTLQSDNNAVSVEYTITKDSEVPPRSGYDYDVFHNYKIDFGSIEINNIYLLDCIENLH